MCIKCGSYTQVVTERIIQGHSTLTVPLAVFAVHPPALRARLLTSLACLRIGKVTEQWSGMLSMDRLTLEHQVCFFLLWSVSLQGNARENLEGSFPTFDFPQEHYSESCKETSNKCRINWMFLYYKINEYTRVALFCFRFHPFNKRETLLAAWTLICGYRFYKRDFTLGFFNDAVYLDRFYSVVC
jgi:hypothetical protein